MPREPVAAWASDCADTPDMLRPDSARAPLLNTPEAAARVAESEGENDPLAPEPETAATKLEACAEPVFCCEELGVLRAVPCPVAVDCAVAREFAMLMLWPVSARAALLATPERAARALETDGARAALLPAALAVLGALWEVALCAEADCDEVLCGVPRAELWPVAERAMVSVLAMLMLWLASAWAPRLITVELAALALEGFRALFAPAAPAVLGAAALLAAADWAEAAEGALRAAFIPEADCAIDCAEGALMLWLVSARAWPVCMLAMAACEVDGANEPLAPAALAEF